MTEVTQNADGSVTHSIDLADLSIEQLVEISQGLGRQIDKLREQRAYLASKIAERVAKGERESVNAMQAAIAAGDGFAPGAVIEASARGG